jgi:hypothetical protein
MSIARPANDTTMSQIQARLQRLERQNRVLIVLLCAAVGIASVAAARAAPTIVIADEIRAHHFSVLDPTGAVVSEWYSDEPGAWYDPPGANKSHYLGR